MKKPTKEEAKVLSNLFPSSSRAHKRQAFNPHDDCVAEPSHSKKKKFAKPTTQKAMPKLSTVEVVALKKFQTRLPKGGERKKLQYQGLHVIVKVKSSHDMTAQQVKQKITKIFKDLP